MINITKLFKFLLQLILLILGLFHLKIHGEGGGGGGGGGWNAHNFRPPPMILFSCNPPPPPTMIFFSSNPPPPMIFITFSKPHTQCVFLHTTRKRLICENARIEYARHFLLFTTLYFFFFSSSFLFFSFHVLFLLAIYVHSRVSRSIVSGVHFFLAGLYSDSQKNTPESRIWQLWIHFTRVGTRYVTFKH